MCKNIVAYLTLVIGLLIFSGCSTNNIEPASKLDNVEIDTGDTTEVSQPTDTMKVHYIDVGQADATLLQLIDQDETINLLIDTGDWNASDVVTYLHSQQIKDIDIVAVTHPHADHIGQLDKIIENFSVTEVWMNGETANSQVFAKSLEAIEKHDVDYYEPEIGEIFDIGPLEITILHPDALSANTNNNSLAMRLQYGEVSFLFTGDAEQLAENAILSSGANIQAKILHLGHHGSNTSSTPEFVQAVNPEIAIYSAGVDNSYGHPDVEVIDRFNVSNIPLYGTDTHGTIIVETDGETYTVMTQKQGTLPFPSAGKSCLDINTANAEELQEITHIGPALANALIKLRPYRTVDELSNIKGIGPGRLHDIKSQGLACVGG
ncbi:MBL fold metallo-hydrolase [Sporosarcina beigongshangi]|uniref:MBL fold metallo-hydrolase n=1 Tax=Sporosarcina beigongshangi TaxID=2782538 RepID=UPI00193A00A2|nr:MBL fold metallo-hydrolase [Sporosarcina beigongshangi]